jgi:excisionase family DNA binding protein
MRKLAASEKPLVYTVDEAAHLLRMSRQTVYEAARRGEVPSIRIGRRVLVPRVALEKLIGLPD